MPTDDLIYYNKETDHEVEKRREERERTMVTSTPSTTNASSSTLAVSAAAADHVDRNNDDKWRDTLFFWQGDLTTSQTRIILDAPPPDDHIVNGSTTAAANTAAASSTAAAASTALPAAARSIIRDVVWQGTRLSIPHCPDARRAARPIRFPNEEKDHDEKAPQFSLSGRAFNIPNCSSATKDSSRINADNDEFDTQAATIVSFLPHYAGKSGEDEDGFELDEEEPALSSSSSSRDQPTTSNNSSTDRYHDDEHFLVFSEGLYQNKQIVIGQGRNAKFGSFLEIGWSREQFDGAHEHQTAMAEMYSDDCFFTPNDELATEDYTQPFVMNVIVARRYLKDDDERSGWSLNTLAAQLAMNVAFSPFGDESWRLILEFVHGTFRTRSLARLTNPVEYYLTPFFWLQWKDIHPAWQTLVLHAELWGHQNHHDDDEDDQVDDNNVGAKMLMVPNYSGLPTHLLRPLPDGDDEEEPMHGGRVVDFSFH
jgi:hypothetical protein